MNIQCAQFISNVQASVNFSPVQCPSGYVPLKTETTNEDHSYQIGNEPESRKARFLCSYRPVGAQDPMPDGTALKLLTYPLTPEHAAC